MRWLAIKRDNGKLEDYAVAFAAHTVSLSLEKGCKQYTAWRLGKAIGESVILGVFDTSSAAKLACERDARGEKQPEPREDAA